MTRRIRRMVAAVAVAVAVSIAGLASLTTVTADTAAKPPSGKSFVSPMDDAFWVD
jgi:hypothetical protein